MSEKTNPSIKCSVDSCAYHSAQQAACTLNEIKVGCACTEVASCTATECASFQLGDHGTCCKR